MTQPNLGVYRRGVDGNFFNTLTNTHPNQRRVRTIGQDPRNDQDYDTFDYGTEPLPGDRNWVRNARASQNMGAPNIWKNAYPIK